MKASSRCTDKTKSGSTEQSRPGRWGGRNALLPALVVLGSGCSLFAASVSALELGELEVHSTLGQPLRASVAYALQPNEQIHAYCVYLKPGRRAEGLPSVSNAAITVGNGAIRVTGRTSVREPLLALQLTVDCPRTAHLSREYSLFIDRGLPAQQPVAARAADGSRTTVSPPAEAAAKTGSPRLAREPIQSSASYRVQPGDSLSGIAKRISGRNVGIWEAVDAIFVANTEAFIDNDRNLLRAGAVLAIPDSILSARATGIIRSQVAPGGAAASQPVSEPTDISGRTGRAADSVKTPKVPESALTERGGSGDSASAQANAGTPQPGDVLLGSDGPFVSPVDADTLGSGSGEFAAPAPVSPQAAGQQTAASAAVPGARSESGAADNSLSRLMWLAGTGIALILGLLLFGRRLKDRFRPESAAARGDADATGAGDADRAQAPGLHAVPVARVVSLDADLDDGSGFQYGDVDIAQDFGFSADSGQFNKRLGMDTGAARADDSHQTDILAPRRVQEATILVSETPPQHDDTGEYDVSMIVDATKPILDDVDETARDLHAVEVAAVEDRTGSGAYIVSKDVDYSVLEQDYQDELTATQALNAEIARAARALSQQYGKDEMGDTLADTMNEEVGGFEDETSQLPLAAAPEPADGMTTALPAAGAARGEDDALTISSTTMSLDDTANEEIALEVPAAENDSTVEVENGAASVGSRQKRAY